MWLFSRGHMLGLAFSVAVGLPQPILAFETQALCDRAYAQTTLKTGSYAVFCSCTQVSDRFLRTIQRSDAFQAVLATTSDLCAPLASLLTDPVTASLPGSRIERLDRDEQRLTREGRDNTSSQRSSTQEKNRSAKKSTRSVKTASSSASRKQTSSVSKKSSKTNGSIESSETTVPDSNEVYNGW